MSKSDNEDYFNILTRSEAGGIKEDEEEKWKREIKIDNLTHWKF